MASNLQLVRSPGSMRERLILALDVDDLERVKALVSLLGSKVGMFKVGKQLFTHAGPQAVKLIQGMGGEVFLDLKFHDIPNTVAKAAIEATRLGVKMFNVHASGSLEMMRLTVREVSRVCRQEGLRRPIMLAVTVLTSLNKSDLQRVGVDGEVADQVIRLALLTRQAGMDGVVASPQEVAPIRAFDPSGGNGWGCSLPPGSRINTRSLRPPLYHRFPRCPTSKGEAQRSEKSDDAGGDDSRGR